MQGITVVVIVLEAVQAKIPLIMLTLHRMFAVRVKWILGRDCT